MSLDHLDPAPLPCERPAEAAAQARPTPIADYGLLGDTRTAALVSIDGSVDWLCAPAFDGEPLFGALLGGPEAGSFLAGPAGPAAVISRSYRHSTATLETVWAVGAGRLTLTEAMIAEVAGQLLPTTILVRRLAAAVFGLMDFATLAGGTPAHRTALIHMSLNLTAVALFAVSCFLRLGSAKEDFALVPFILSVVGYLVVGASGYLGGKLAYHYGVRVADEKTQGEGFV